ncbi:pyrimidine dimer DNA glycosylase/endonuclease V [Demequina sp.]|uniref:pyrimidine dimer DNA glycosylase/endonuclease V n=1 Tax=Demequina sp. TaxID=2050685 RepID=UPI003D0A8A15
MRLWSLHPSQLDRAALVACWREALLAQAVLAGRTRGYTRHPQLDRFRAGDDSAALIGKYLTALATEADARGYRFDRGRIDVPGEPAGDLTVTSGQVAHEWAHLAAKLAVRSPDDARRLAGSAPQPHPLFTVVEGGVETWERA